jgi:hypothetical protein
MWLYNTKNNTQCYVYHVITAFGFVIMDISLQPEIYLHSMSLGIKKFQKAHKKDVFISSYK